MDKDFCKFCIYCSHDILANARCTHPAKEKDDGHAPIISDYDLSCEDFKDEANCLE